MDIRVEYIDFKEIAEWPRNPKDHDIPAIQKSFDRFGFIKPILVDEGTEQLVAGHGRLNSLQGMRKDGKSPPRGIKVVEDTWLVPVLRGVAFKDPAEAEAFLLADNRLSEVGGWDKDLLDEMLAEMGGGEVSLEGTGFTSADIPDIESLGAIPGVGSGSKGKFISCPKCGFEWEK